MTDEQERVFEFAEHAARDGFQSVAVRTELMTPHLAAAFLRRLPAEEGFNPAKIATRLQHLPNGTGKNVQLGKAASQAFLGVAIPQDPKRAFEWAQELMTATSATSVKMNFAPAKATNVKIFWRKPEVNTLVEVGGVEA